MDKLKILNRHLPFRSKILMAVFFLMALGLLTFLTSPFLLIWCNWGLAWRVGATGLCSVVVLFAAWWFLYNTFFATKKAISNE